MNRINETAMMNKTLFRFRNIVFSSFVSMCALANADHFPQEIIIIGDSLSDSGNSRPSFFIVNMLPAPRYAPATNGTTWPVYLAGKLEAEQLSPSSEGGTNFAYVGALTDGTFSFFPNPSLTQQEQSLPPKTNRNNPVFIFGGANDIFFDPAIPSPGNIAAVNIGNILDSLHGEGYKTLIVLNLPDIGKIPSAGASAAEYTFNALLFNSVLQQELKNKDYPVIEVDIFSVFEKLLANPEAFGLDNATSAPDPSPLTGQPEAGFVFYYDGTHPSNATHLLISDYVFSILSAAECYATLAEIPFGVLREQRTNIHQQLVPMQPLHEKFLFYPFVSGSYSPHLSPPLADSCGGHDSYGGDVCFGFTDRVSDSWTVGAAGSYARANSTCHEQENKCHFEMNAGILSLFAGYNKNHGYVNGIFNVAWLDYADVKRKFHVGPDVNQTHGDTSGMDYDAELYGAYYIWSYSSFKTGPLLEMNFQRVLVDGYKEHGADYGNIRYRDQGNTIFSTGLGWEAWLSYTFKGVGFVTDMFVTANRQWLGKLRHIHFNETSLPDTNGAWPVRSHRNTFASGGLNFSALFKNRLIASLGYTFNVGTFDMSEQFITASLTMPLGKKKQAPTVSKTSGSQPK